MQLNLQKGSHLYTSIGEDLGTLRQFVVEPNTSEVTHVKVEKGWFFQDDRVVPVSAIDYVDEDRVVLSEVIEPDALPRFVPADYVPLDDDTRSRLPVGGDYVWRYPITYGAPFPAYPVYPMPEQTVESRIDDPVVRAEVEKRETIDADAPVFSVTGRTIGKVLEIQIDGHGRPSHFVVDLGFLEGARILPGHWIESVDSDGVRLAVGDGALMSLETVA